jgi:uncharacterized small protein (TIGR04563 family)
MHVSQKRKVTLYFNSAMLAETQKEAIRQDRSVSWIIQAAWRIARDEVKKMPATGIAMQAAAPELPELPDEPTPLPLHPLLDTRSQA